MKKFTREEIRQNRLKFAKGLQEPHREKILGKLEDTTDNNRRCCLGHGCEIFNLSRLEGTDGDMKIYYGKEKNELTAPKELIALLGLYNQRGGTNRDGFNSDTIIIYDEYTSLTTLNDQSTLTSQQIGELIEGWVEGGEATPFIPLSEFAE